jgi:prepilin-type N-terminal cleavage/methylation domain-containing protein
MERTANVNTKKGFSLVEFLIALIILTLSAIALFNLVVLFIHNKVKTTIVSHAPDAARNLVLYPEKVKNCNVADPCNGFSTCQSSIYCGSNVDVCSSNNTCITCYTNPDNGRKIYYSFNASNIGNGDNTYKVILCWKYAGITGNYTTVITLNP